MADSNRAERSSGSRKHERAAPPDAALAGSPAGAAPPAASAPVRAAEPVPSRPASGLHGFLERLAERLRPAPLIDVLVVSKKPCGLCDDALAELARHRRRLGLRIRVADITGDETALARFGDRVPVVFLDGVERMFGHVDPFLLARDVEGIRRRRPGQG